MKFSNTLAPVIRKFIWFSVCSNYRKTERNR